MSRFTLLLFLSPLALSGCGFGTTVDDTDGSNPFVQITKPVGNTVSGVVDFAANALDDTGIEVVEFYVGETLLFSDSAEPYETQWNSATSPDGPVTLRVVARDAAGNAAHASKTVSVNHGPI